ncbi:hypothetical protein CFP56_026246 [Quercus suber]|uniref:Uncharacterized protein n=1 Tax=Quercus suber TaxID=58331 RepID=A0AAW0K2C1_QUESU
MNKSSTHKASSTKKKTSVKKIEEDLAKSRAAIREAIGQGCIQVRRKRDLSLEDLFTEIHTLFIRAP